MANKITITQGDALDLTLTCSGHDLTGATLTTKLPKSDGTDLVLSNSVHTIDADQTTNPGSFTVALTAEESASLNLGASQSVLTKVEQSGDVIHFHGKGILTVKAATTVETE